MRILPTLTLATTLGGLAALAPAAHAEPPLCTPNVITVTLIGAGRLAPEDAGNGGINLIRCGDLTKDGGTDVLFTIASGGTAGDTQFGVIAGGADGAGELVLFRNGYKIGVARRNSGSFEVLQPHYRGSDPNCCPSSFRQTRYTWTGTRFKRGTTKKRKTAPARYRA
jgi:hypothetical protein